MSRPTGRAARSGFSLFEMMVVVSLLGLIAGSVGTLGLRANEAARVTRVRNEVQVEARRVADRVAHMLEGTAVGVLVPDPGALGTDALTFRAAAGFVGSAIQWGEATRLRFQIEPGEVNDGEDDDGDGLVDEGQIVLTRDLGGPTQLDVRLCSGVSEYLEGETPNAADDNGNGMVDERGFVVQRNGNLLVLRFTLMRPMSAGQPALSTIETAVLLRN